MKARFFLLFFISLFTFTSCFIEDSSESKDSLILGKVIVNYPDWCNALSYEGLCDFDLDNGCLLCYGYSSWIDWQSESGKRLQNYVSNKIMSNSYSGKYRILLTDQRTVICFNDKDSTHAFFYNYYADYLGKNDSKSVENESLDSDNFEYDAWFRPYHLTGNYGYVIFDSSKLEDNYAHIVLSKLTDNSFNYTLSIGNQKIIDTELTNYKASYGVAELSEIKSWIPNRISEINTERSIFLIRESKNTLALPRVMISTCFSFEGISLRKIDNESKIISFNLLDSDESDFADFFEITQSSLIFYKKNEQESLEVVTKFDENKIIFN